MRVLVTGGTGYLGQAIVRALVRRGHEPVVFARHASTVAGLPGRAIDGDIRDPAAVLRAMDTADAVCHAAARVSVWRPRREDFDEVNVAGLQVVLDACRTLSIPRITYTSSFLALPPAGHSAPLQTHDYQRTKVVALGVARRAVAGGVPIVTLVPGVIYGPGEATEGNLVGRMVRDHLAGRLPGIVGAERIWSYAYVDDVAEAHVTAIESGRAGAEYLLGGENAPQMRVFEILRAIRGTPLPRKLPVAVAAAGALVEELRARVTGKPPLVTRGIVQVLRHDWTMDSRVSVDELGYRRTPLETGMRALVSALP